MKKTVSLLGCLLLAGSISFSSGVSAFEITMTKPGGNPSVANATCMAESKGAITFCSATVFAMLKLNPAVAHYPTSPFVVCATTYGTCLASCTAALGTCLPACDAGLKACATATCTAYVTKAVADQRVHLPWVDPFVMDMGASISRGIQVAIKFFLADDNKIVAELVYDGDGSCSGGGCGGAYTGENGNADSGLVLNAVASPLTDIPAEAEAYPSDVKVQDTSIGKLADLRTKEIMKGQASLDELSNDKWAIEYRAQKRAIQALTDALVMKKAYKELAAIAEKVSSGSYSNYSEAASTVATRRLMLDALMALRKRVIAARVRARAETMEAEIDTTQIPTQATLDEMSSVGGLGGTGPTNVVANNNAPVSADNGNN